MTKRNLDQIRIGGELFQAAPRTEGTIHDDAGAPRYYCPFHVAIDDAKGVVYPADDAPDGLRELQIDEGDNSSEEAAFDTAVAQLKKTIEEVRDKAREARNKTSK